MRSRGDLKVAPYEEDQEQYLAAASPVGRSPSVIVRPYAGHDLQVVPNLPLKKFFFVIFVRLRAFVVPALMSRRDSRTKTRCASQRTCGAT